MGMGKSEMCALSLGRTDEAAGQTDELLVDRSNWQPKARRPGAGAAGAICRLVCVGVVAAGEAAGTRWDPGLVYALPARVFQRMGLSRLANG